MMLTRFLSFLLFLGALSVALVGCSDARSGSFLVTVKDRSSGRPVEGAIIELSENRGVSAPSDAPVRGTTDGRGEVLVLMPGWNRLMMWVTFDGEIERFAINGERIPRYDAPKDEIESSTGAVRFLSGKDGKTAWLVTVVKVRDGLK